MSDNAFRTYRRAREAQLVRNEARHIRSKISDARGSRHDAGVRWPFELLQNALDAGPRPGREHVEVWLRRSGDSFSFEHDGAFFTPRDLAALLSGGSGKEFESEDTTGRFGTGFLVTHVLASRTSVSGVLMSADHCERFSLVLDRGGDEDSIVENIAACDAAIQSASFLDCTDDVPSATFTYLTDDASSLDRGLISFRSAIAYLFATCERLRRVHIEMDDDPAEVWEAEVATMRHEHGAVVYRRDSLWRRGTEAMEYRSVRVSMTSAASTSAIAVLVRNDSTWRLSAPDVDFPRAFCRYPIRSSAFLPINAILDAPFDLDQERRRILLDNEAARIAFRSAVTAVVPLVRIAFDEGWEGRHWLARAAPSPSSFADKDDAQETAWITAEIRFLADQLSKLPLVTTRQGVRPAVENDDNEWFADFVDVTKDSTSMLRLWPLVDDATGLCPPIEEEAVVWATIARGWRELGVKVAEIGLAALAKSVKGDAERIDELSVRCDPRAWLTRFLELVGECWVRHGVTATLLDGILPNENGDLIARRGLHRDEGIPGALKDVASILGCDVRSRLVDPTLVQLARDSSLRHVDGALEAAVPAAMSEESVMDECVRTLEKRFPKHVAQNEEVRPLILGSIQLLDYLTNRCDGATWANRIPLLASDGSFARTTPQRRMMAPVECWDERARPFADAYPSDRILAKEYVGTRAASALVEWGIAHSGPLTNTTPSDPIKDDRLRCLAIEGEDTANAHVAGETFSQIALLHELIPRCQTSVDAACLLGLALCYVAPADSTWRESRSVTGRRAGADVALTLRGGLWLADLRSRAWVPLRSDDGKTSPVVPTAEGLKHLLQPSWLHENQAAHEALALFGFDALDLQLLSAPDEESLQRLRDQLALLVELAKANPGTLVQVQADLEDRRTREQTVARCRKFGLDVQEAVRLALKVHGLVVEVVDHGYDFEVTDDLETVASRFEVGSYFVEVKATTHGDAKLTPKQAETASKNAGRYVLCVIDLRTVPDQRLDEAWTPDDVVPLARVVAGIGERVLSTWALVEEARSGEVGLRNERALRYAVPPNVWEHGCSIAEWIAHAFTHRAASTAPAM